MIIAIAAKTWSIQPSLNSHNECIHEAIEWKEKERASIALPSDVHAPCASTDRDLKWPERSLWQ
jgi:hypothetical protein